MAITLQLASRRPAWNHFPLKYLPVALFLIPVVQHAVMLPFMVTAPGGIQWQDSRQAAETQRKSAGSFLRSLAALAERFPRFGIRSFAF